MAESPVANEALAGMRRQYYGDESAGLINKLSPREGQTSGREAGQPLGGDLAGPGSRPLQEEVPGPGGVEPSAPVALQEAAGAAPAEFVTPDMAEAGQTPQAVPMTPQAQALARRIDTLTKNIEGTRNSGDRARMEGNLTRMREELAGMTMPVEASGVTPAVPGQAAPAEPSGLMDQVLATVPEAGVLKRRIDTLTQSVAATKNQGDKARMQKNLDAMQGQLDQIVTTARAETPVNAAPFAPSLGGAAEGVGVMPGKAVGTRQVETAPVRFAAFPIIDEKGTRHIADISSKTAQDINALGFSTKESRVVIEPSSIEYIEGRHGKQLSDDDVALIRDAINDPTEVLPNIGTPDAPHRSKSVLFVRQNGKDFVAVVEVAPDENDNPVWNFWKMSKKRAQNYLAKNRDEKTRRLQPGWTTPTTIESGGASPAVSPEGLSGAQAENAGEENIATLTPEVNAPAAQAGPQEPARQDAAPDAEDTGKAQYSRPKRGVLTDFEREQIAKGHKAIDRVIKDRVDVIDAVERQDLGPVSFIWGKTGDPERNFKGGEGVAKIIAKRTAEGGNGEAVARKMVEVVVLGSPGKIYGPRAGQRVNLSYEGHTAVLSLYRDGNKTTWLLTGWEDETSGAASGGYGPPGATHVKPMRTRPDVVAEASSGKEDNTSSSAVNEKSGLPVSTVKHTLATLGADGQGFAVVQSVDELPDELQAQMKKDQATDAPGVK